MEEKPEPFPENPAGTSRVRLQFSPAKTEKKGLPQIEVPPKIWVLRRFMTGIGRKI